MKLTDAMKGLETVATERAREAEREHLAEARRLRRIEQRDERRIARERAEREAAAADAQERKEALRDYQRERYKDVRLQRAENVLDEETGLVMSIAQKRWVDAARAHYATVDIQASYHGGAIVAVCERVHGSKGGSRKGIIVRIAKSGLKYKYTSVEEALSVRIDLHRKQRKASGRLRRVEEGEIPLALPQDGFRYHNLHAGFEPGMCPLSLGYQWGDSAARDPADFIPERVAGRQVLDTLDERERTILKWRFSGVTLDACGDQFGLTRERIRQVESKALKRLRLGFGLDDAPPPPPPRPVAPEPEFRDDAYKLTHAQREVVRKLLAKHVAVARIAVAANIPVRSMHRVIERYGLGAATERLPQHVTQKSLLDELAALDAPNPDSWEAGGYLWDPVHDLDGRVVFTPEQRAVILRDNMGPSAVAQKMALPHPPEVGKYMEQQGLRQRASKARDITLTPAQKAVAQAALANGTSVVVIAAMLDMKPDTCSQVLDREGLRPRRKYKKSRAGKPVT